MPTHQSLGGASDEQLLLRMVTTHSERYGQDYWAAFDAGVAPHLPASPVVIDLGCGPGLFLLHDWIRQPFQRYLAWRRDGLGETGPEHLGRAFRLFPVHNKYTSEDWQWLLAEAGFAIRHQAAFRQSHRMFVATTAAAAG